MGSAKTKKYLYFDGMFAFKRIGLALAFSPTAEVMLTEAYRVVQLLKATLVIIHVGQRNEADEEKLAALMLKVGVQKEVCAVMWEEGSPAKAILKACDKGKIDLLVTGALRKENLVRYYLGTVARRILRKAPCSVLTIVNPQPIKNIVVNAEDSPYIIDAIETGCLFGKAENAAWVHIVRELKMYGLTMAASDHFSEEEYDQVRHDLVKDEIEKVEKLLTRIPHQGLKVNIKIISGKSGFELGKFAEKKNADLLVVGAPPRKFSFFDRVFPHDLEYIFADLPCNVLIVNPKSKEKEERHG
jgi:nucleotide-binding universal stress UspA family protein